MTLKNRMNVSLFGAALTIVTLFASAGEVSSQSIQINGKQRDYRLALPNDMQQDNFSLILNFHGTSSTPKQQADLSDVEKLAESKNIIVVSPKAVYTRTPDGPRTWNVAKDPAGVDDVAFIGQLIDKLEGDYNIDENQIYAMGFSGGARMSSRLACDLSEDIAAIAPVAGIRYPNDCSPTRPVPVLTFHGTQDRVNHYVLQEDSPPYWSMGVDEAIARWVKQNRCEDRVKTTGVSDTAVKIEYEGCKAPVLFYRSTRSGHTWPGSPQAEKLKEVGLGETENTIPASKLILTFFAQHPMSK